MPKAKRTISTVLPTYQKDRQRWRKKILENVRRAAEEKGVRYEPSDSLEVDVILYLKRAKRYAIHDVDNRLKDILDALQGRFRGFNSRSRRIVANDNKICRAVVEKRETPKIFNKKKKDTGGKITIRPYRRNRQKSK